MCSEVLEVLFQVWSQADDEETTWISIFDKEMKLEWGINIFGQLADYFI